MASRTRKGSKRLDMAQLREALKDGRLWTALGVVTKFPGESSHFEILGDGDGVMVDVEFMPNRERVACRLGTDGGGGVWRIPPVGTEVAVLIPSGDLDMDAIITATVSDPPSQLADGVTVVVASGAVKVIAPAVELGDAPAALDGVVVGTGIDPFTGVSYSVLGNTSTIVRAKK